VSSSRQWLGVDNGDDGGDGDGLCESWQRQNRMGIGVAQPGRLQWPVLCNARGSAVLGFVGPCATTTVLIKDSGCPQGLVGRFVDRVS
jgi:hypothetical protein